MKKHKRLSLNKMTIAHLASSALSNVNGGQKPVTISACGGECTLGCPGSAGCTGDCYTQVACTVDRFCV